MAKATKQTTSKTAAPKKAPASQGRSGKAGASVAPPAKGGPAGKGASSAKAADPKADIALPVKRKLGLRGAAPWAARHAAKHAAEARARAAEPAPPGSARATIRVPNDAENIKAKIAELHNQTTKIRNLKKRLEKGFFEIGEILAEVQTQGLYEAKGYGSFEAFLEREIDLGKSVALKLIKIAHVFQREAALDFGMDRLFAALSALEGDVTMPKPSQPSNPGLRPPLPLKPPMRIVG